MELIEQLEQLQMSDQDRLIVALVLEEAQRKAKPTLLTFDLLTCPNGHLLEVVFVVEEGKYSIPRLARIGKWLIAELRKFKVYCSQIWPEDEDLWTYALALHTEIGNMKVPFELLLKMLKEAKAANKDFETVAQQLYIDLSR